MSKMLARLVSQKGIAVCIELVNSKAVRIFDVARPFPLQATLFLARMACIVFQRLNQFFGFSRYGFDCNDNSEHAANYFTARDSASGDLLFRFLLHLAR